MYICIYIDMYTYIYDVYKFNHIILNANVNVN